MTLCVTTRSPLTSLRLNAELLAAGDGLSEAERKEVLGRIVAQADELGQLVTDITDLAGDQERSSILEEVKLHEVVAAELDAARRDWPCTEFSADLFIQQTGNHKCHNLLLTMCK